MWMFTWTWFPLFEHDRYIGYFAGDEVYYIENGEIVKIESVNSYFAKKLLNFKTGKRIACGY